MTITAVVLMFLSAVTSPQEMLQSAQTNLRAERWEEAAKTLDELVSSTDDQDATVHYDRGVAHYNLKRFDVAANAFEEAMVKSDDPALASYSAYNFGNAMYQSALRDLEGTSSQGEVHEALSALETAKDQIGQAIEGYRRSIQRDPLDSDARANGELAWNMLQQLTKMQQQMEQQQQEDLNQEQEQVEESAQQQADNQQNKEQGDSQQEQKQQGEESQDEQEGEQSSNAQKSEQGQPSSQEQKSQDSANPEQDQQQSNQDRREQGDQQEGGPSADSRDEQPDENEADESEDSQQQDEDQGELESLQGEREDALPPQNEEKGKGQRLSRNEAARLLQLIRDKEQERRKTLAARRAARRVPVQKDW